MTPNPVELDQRMADVSADGFLIHASSRDPDQRYLSGPGFYAPDPFVTLYADGDIHVLVTGFEAVTARREGTATTVSRYEDYGSSGRITDFGDADNCRILVEFLRDHGVESLVVDAGFPVGTADCLRSEGVPVHVDSSDLVTQARATKSSGEIEAITDAQRANERAMAVAERMIREAGVREGTLFLDGSPLTSERVRAEIEKALLEHDAIHDSYDPFVACGADGADPHSIGSGPLRSDEPIVVDIFARNRSRPYYGDITRTFVKGTPSDELRRRFDAVMDVRQRALDAVRAGVPGAEIQDVACEAFESRGYETVRRKPDTETGFIHRIGHGVGLELHEHPRLAPDGDELEAGNVITIEPGLYDPEVGGVRIEDLVVVTEDGYENLTEYPVELVV